MSIRSFRVVLCRAIVGVLDSRGVGIHGVAEACRISPLSLRRLLEFGSPLGDAAAQRLIDWGLTNGARLRSRNAHSGSGWTGLGQ